MSPLKADRGFNTLGLYATILRILLERCFALRLLGYSASNIASKDKAI